MNRARDRKREKINERQRGREPAPGFMNASPALNHHGAGCLSNKQIKGQREHLVTKRTTKTNEIYNHSVANGLICGEHWDWD